MKPFLAALLLAAVAAAPHAASAAQSAAGSPACFRPEQVQRYATPDERSVFLRTNRGEIFQFDFAGRCPNVRQAGAISFVAPQNVSPRICEGQNVQVAVPTTLGPALHCQVTNLRRLTPAEAKALPDRARP
ncbi:DUF6491 family protein [Phenylobacterium deserti]|uniref:Beta/gamma crystallin 'Greek key' domain-containing protein n=1 Tax=Phenylobacterium deserti TaxID=1914756 RepID=A0A328AU09_9CAUL|nr:DUF6491 family protein [Phenylobacterium deserti]RAK57004.1 hypothetical protein DJ018_03295 [Phenylobacterium deserti]